MKEHLPNLFKKGWLRRAGHFAGGLFSKPLLDWGHFRTWDRYLGGHQHFYTFNERSKKERLKRFHYSRFRRY